MAPKKSPYRVPLDNDREGFCEVDINRLDRVVCGISEKIDGEDVVTTTATYNASKSDLAKGNVRAEQVSREDDDRFVGPGGEELLEQHRFVKKNLPRFIQQEIDVHGPPGNILKDLPGKAKQLLSRD